MILLNGIEDGRLDARDRGLAYGDGVFRTLRLRNGKPLLWQLHYAKLAADSAAIGIACPPAAILEIDLDHIAAAHADGVIRITLTRGISARGYAVPQNVAVTRIVSWSEWLPPFAFDPDAGVKLHWCKLRLAIQPALAGIKHLNRLENVLARAEWQDPAIAEGLLCDAEGHVIGGTMSNVFLLRDAQLVTPALTGAGIAGVTRDLIIERARAAGMAVRIAVLTPKNIRAAEAVFVVNSVIGVWPVVMLDDMTWPMHPFTATLKSWIRDAETR